MSLLIRISCAGTRMPSRRRASVSAAAGVDAAGFVGGAGGAREAARDGDDPGAVRLRHRPGEGLDEVLGELRYGDGEGVARPGDALTERAPVGGGRQHGTRTGATGVEPDDEGTGRRNTVFARAGTPRIPTQILVQFIAHRALWWFIHSPRTRPTRGPAQSRTSEEDP